MVWPKTTDDDDGPIDSLPPPQPSASDSEPTPSSSPPESGSQESNLSSSSYPSFPQQAPVLLVYNSSNGTASSSSPPANSYEDYYHPIPSAQPRTHDHYYPRITHSISATESSTQLPSPPDSNFVLSPTPPEQNQQHAPLHPLPQLGGQLLHDTFDQTSSDSVAHSRPPARQLPRQPIAKSGDEEFINDDDDDDAALNSILDGVGKMHITMGRDHSGRWRIRRTGDTLD